MKNLSKIISLVLALFLLMPMAIGAAGNPDDIPGSIQYADTVFYAGSSGRNYFSIMPAHGSTNGGGFGSSNPIGVARVGGFWPTEKTLPLFELLAYDRTSGAFNPKTLVSLSPDGMQYKLPDGGHGFSYSIIGPTKQGDQEAFYGEPGEKYSPVVSFTATFDGKFEWSISFQRKNSILSNKDLTGMQLKYYKNNTLIHVEVVNTNSKTTISVQEQLKKGDVLYLEFDPMENNIKDDEFYVRDLKVFCLSHYDGVIDSEYDNSGETPLLSVALVTDVHSDRDMCINDIPVYENYIKTLDIIKKRGNVDAILLGGDIVSENNSYNNDPPFNDSNWTNERIDRTVSFIFDEALKATQNGKGKVLAVSGNHDKDAGVVAAHDKETNKCGDIEEVHAGDYYKYFSQNSMSGEAMKTLRFNDMGEGFHSPFNEVVCYRYNIGGLEIIGITQSHSNIKNVQYPGQGCPLNGIDDDNLSNAHRYSAVIWREQAEWVANELDEIGTDKTVVVLCHYNMGAGEMTVHGANNVLLESFDKHPNVIYAYGHQHGSNDRSETWYNTIEHFETLGNRVQLNDGSYATDSWQYVYIGSVRYGPYSAPTLVSQFLTMDIYNDHITFQTHNAGDESTVSDVRTPSSYTIKREMSQIDGYTGDGSGNIEMPEIPIDATVLQHIPTSVSDVKKLYVMDLGMNNLVGGPFSLKGILELTNAKIPLSEEAELMLKSENIYQHKYDGKALVQTSQGGGMFDMRAAIGYSAAMIFTAPETGAYKYEVDMTRLWGSGDDCQIKVMKGGSILLDSFTPEKERSAPIDLSGYVYLEKGEDIRIIVAKSVNTKGVSSNEIAVNSFVVKQYDSYTLPEAGSDGGNTQVGVCPHSGGIATCCTRAVCEKCGAEYGNLNPNNHASNETIETMTYVKHKSVRSCCGKIIIGEGYHAFENGKCLVCGFECDHDGYVEDGTCKNCRLSDIPQEDNDEKESGLPEIVIYVIIAVEVLIVGVAVALIVKRSLKKK